MDAKPIDIIVLMGTTSALKAAAIKEAFESSKEAVETALKIDLSIPLETTPVFHFVYIPSAATSEVNEQPYGWKEIIEGAKNRLKNAIKISQLEKEPDFVIAIENGIVPIPEAGNCFLDTAWVEFATKHRGSFSSMSTSTEVKSEWIEKAKEVGLEQKTIGDVCHELYEGVSAKDPHLWILGGVMGRMELVKQAIKSCIGSWVREAQMSKLSSNVTPTHETQILQMN